MIVGGGDIGKALVEAGVDRPELTFFAKGVSNSKEERIGFSREINDLRKMPPDAHVVYFSSLCIYYSDSIYAVHKKAMECRVKSEFTNYTIIRLGNITWGNNPNTIINYFKQCKSNGIQPEIQDTYRYLITKDEFIHWIKMIRVGVNDIMNLPGAMVSINEIWRRVIDGKY